MPHNTPTVDVGQQLLMVSDRQRPAGAERAERTSPLLRGFSSQWGGGGCLPRPESPVIPLPRGSSPFPSRAGQAGRGTFRRTEAEGSGARVGCAGDGSSQEGGC